MFTRSGLTYLEVSSEVCHDSFCQLGNSVSLSWAVCHEAFCLHVLSSSSCIPVVCLEPVLFLIPLQCVNLFCNLSKCILLYPAAQMKLVIKCSSVRRLRYLDLSSTERRLLRVDRLIQKMLVNEELLILLRGHTEFDGHQKAATIYQTSGHD